MRSYIIPNTDIIVLSASIMQGQAASSQQDSGINFNNTGTSGHGSPIIPD